MAAIAVGNSVTFLRQTISAFVGAGSAMIHTKFKGQAVRILVAILFAPLECFSFVFMDVVAVNAFLWMVFKI